MSLPTRFLGAFAKYQRAQVHILALNQALDTYYGAKPWQPEKTDDVPEGMVRIRLLQPPPDEIGLILRDAVHNMRSALDYATCSLVEFGHKNVVLSRTQFPFGEPERALTVKEKKGAALGDIAIHALIMIEEARRCGGKALKLLKLLSIKISIDCYLPRSRDSFLYACRSTRKRTQRILCRTRARSICGFNHSPMASL